MNVFLSYSSSEREFAQRLASDLKKLGLDVFSEDSVHPGDNWADATVKGIRQCDLLVPIFGKGSPSVMFEIGAALGREIPVLPVITAESYRRELPNHLLNSKRIEASSAEEAAAQIARSLPSAAGA